MVASHNGACRLGAVLASCVAALALSAQVARADPPEDPHKPDMTKGYCPGGRWGWGNLAVCDGEKVSRRIVLAPVDEILDDRSAVLLRLRRR